MRRMATIMLFLTLAAWCAAQESATVTPETLDWTVADEQNPLPRYLTPAERKLPIDRPTQRDFTLRAPPTGAVRCPAEYEDCQGMFIAWEAETGLLQAMTVAVTTGDPDAVVYVVVDSTSEQTSVSNTLNSAGADMSQVEFIVRTTDSVWIRDYGPRFIFEDGNRAIIDHTYNRPRPFDNQLNDYISTLWGEPQYDIPLTHGGGNFHLFSNGDAFMSSLILAENPGLSEQDVKDLYAEYQNVNLTIYTGFPTSFDATRHIDMWMMPVGDFKVIIGQYAPATGQPYTITENAVADMTSKGYTVYRTPGWSAGGTHYTYTNAVVLNDQVFISSFGSPYTTQDAQALAVFQSAMPGYTITQLNCASIIQLAGALHCIVMHVPAYPSGPIPTVTVFAPDGGETWNVGQVYDITWTATDDVGVTAIDIAYSTDGGATYPHVIATGEPNDGTFAWTIPNTPSEQCRVKVTAHDVDLNTGEDVSNADFTIAVAPELIYAFPLGANPGWTMQGLWMFGDPTGGGSHNHDPSTGYSGANVYGYNIYGDYSNGMATPMYLTTGALDCSGQAQTELRFRRWLGVEASPIDNATIEVSPDGLNWTTVWHNPTTIVSDSSWSLQTVDISAVADDQETVYVRWGMGPTDAGVTYPGWNIDDIEIWAIPGAAGPCDIDQDGDVDVDDYVGFSECITGAGAGLRELPGDCPRCDRDDDEDVDLADFGAFQTCFPGSP